MSLRLLLIEDDPISQEVIRSLLVGRGHRVEVAADGFGALEKLASASFDAALVDYHLPEMDGFALGRLIRDERRGQGRPPVLIGLTADRNGLAARRGSDAVFRAILPKPVEPAELFATLDRLLSPVEAPVVPPVVVGEAGAASPTLLWGGHGLPHAPRAFVAPAPLPDQVEALSLCFDLAPSAEAEIVLLIERHGIGQALAAARPGTGKALPIVGVSRDLADLCDLIFDVGDPEAWSCLAARLGAVPMTEAPAEPMPLPVLAREAPVEAAVAADELSVAELATMLRDGVSRPLDAAAAALDTADAESARESLRAARRALGIVTAASPAPSAVAAPPCSNRASSSGGRWSGSARRPTHRACRSGCGSTRPRPGRSMPMPRCSRNSSPSCSTMPARAGGRAPSRCTSDFPER